MPGFYNTTDFINKSKYYLSTKKLTDRTRPTLGLSTLTGFHSVWFYAKADVWTPSRAIQVLPPILRI